MNSNGMNSNGMNSNGMNFNDKNSSGNSSNHVLDLVDDYLHDLLPEFQARQLEEHCGTCAVCGAALQSARKRHAVLLAVAPVEASQELIQTTLGKIARRQHRRQQVWWWSTRCLTAATAASLLVLGGLTLYFYNMRPTPYDIRVLGQRELLAGTQTEMRVGVFNRLNGQPVAGVPLSILLHDPRGKQQVRLASLQTGPDGAGVASLQLPDWDAGKYEFRVDATPGRGVESVTRWIELRRSWKLMLTSDKPVYQPGQTIHLRALALKQPDLKPLAGQAAMFQVEDPRGNVIFKQSVESSEFGIGHTDCLLAREILEGDYQLRCQIGDVRSDVTVKVARYVLPKFKVGLELDKPFYQPGQPIEATVQADYFFGQPVKNAEVAIHVGSEGKEPLRVRTDESGRAVATLPLPSVLAGVEQESGAARLELVVQVTDSAGQAEAARAVALVSNSPIQLAVVPAAGTLVMDVENRIFIQATSPDGKPVADATIQLAGQDETLRTDSLGIATFDLTPKQSSITLDITATDAQDNVTRRRVELAAGGFGDDFLLLSDRAFYRGGDTMTLSVRGGGVEPVFVDLIRDGQTVVTRTIELSEGQGELDVDLPAELFGPLRVVAYRFGSAGVAVRKSRMIFVRRADDLRITAELDADEYRPGQHARLRLQVSDEQGQPVPGAISLAAVDEAVFSVLNQQPGMERRFFLLENDLLEPAYTIYGWSALDDADLPADQRIQLEQALFARTAHSARGSSVVPVRLAAGIGSENRSDSPIMAEDRYWSPDSPRALGNEQSPRPHTLAVASFQEKSSWVARLRRERLQLMVLAWFGVASIMGLSLLAMLAYFRPLLFAVVTVAGCGLGCFLVLPLLLLTKTMSPSDFATGMASSEEMSDPPSEDMQAGGGRPRVRQKFPETLFWKPELITDDAGEAVLEFDLADSITTWRVTASAVSAQGQLGGDLFPIRVFQPFFVDFALPVALTRHDEVAVPVVVYNYLDQPQTVDLELQAGDWFELLERVADEAAPDAEPPSRIRQLILQPGEVRAVHFPLKALRVGRHSIEVTARGGELSDAVRREVEVVPNGRKTERVVSGLLNQPLELPLDVPEEIVPGSATAVVTLHPSHFSQLVEGLDSILQLPHGCFEQTSSATYPNVLALDYLRSAKLNAPDVEAKARQYIHVGYQRLLTFEVSGGGFDWYGRPPANLVLTAYGLMEFQDMAKVSDVDPRLIERTRRWLLQRGAADGSWSPDDRTMNAVVGQGDATLSTTAYIAWSVFQSDVEGFDGGPTRDFLLAHRADTIDDPYTLALVINALAVLHTADEELAAYVTRLDALKQVDERTEQVWWPRSEGERTMFFGNGQAGDIESTAMAALALITTNRHPSSVRGSLSWLVAQKDPQGNWHSTQATVLALKALLAGSDAADQQKPRQLEVLLDGKTAGSFLVEPDQLGVVQRVELSDLAAGSHSLVVRDLSGQASGYHVAFRYYQDLPAEGPLEQPLSIEIQYDRQQLQVDERVIATATVVNHLLEVAPMVMLDLPIPPGFVLDTEELDELVGSNTIARYEVTARQAIVYLRQLEAGQTLRLRYRLRATMPVRVAVPQGQVYEYYNPQQRTTGGGTQFVVREA